MAADTFLRLTHTASPHPPSPEQAADSPTTSPSARPMSTAVAAVLLLEALGCLALFDVLLLLGYKRVSAFTKSRRVVRRVAAPDAVSGVCRLVEEACVWYYKRVYCLQRSSVTTWMLRRRGIRAELVIGYRPVPVDSHAWVEVDGRVVNDRPQYQIFYNVLERL